MVRVNVQRLSSPGHTSFFEATGSLPILSLISTLFEQLFLTLSRKSLDILLNLSRMKIAGISGLLLLILALAGCIPAKQSPSDEAAALLRRSCAYLWAQQADDGGWHSETHGIMKGGQAHTPFILHALLMIPDSVYPKEETAIRRAFDFIRQRTNADGVLGLADPFVSEYPNYATAYALRVLAANGSDKALAKQMTDYLVAQQFDRDRGIDSAHLAYGGWGFGETNLEPGYTGHVDLSHTRRVLEALRIAGVQTDPVYRNARSFLKVVQKNPMDPRPQPGVDQLDSATKFYDGGFYYSPIITGANKGGRDEASKDYQAHYNSYATATCDGLLALLAAGYDKDSEPVRDAIHWLELHPVLQWSEGIPTDDADQWHKVMKYYHLMVRAEAYHAIDWPGNWPKKYMDILRPEIREDGSFMNPHGAPNKEDDPLLATAMAVIALHAVLHAI